MTYTDKHIIETYLRLFEGLNTVSKMGLIESLSKSLKEEEKVREDNFYKSFGSFVSNKSAEEIISDIKSSRKFRKRETKF